MVDQRQGAARGAADQAGVRSGFLGSLRDALVAASRDDTGQAQAAAIIPLPPPAPAGAVILKSDGDAVSVARKEALVSAAEAAREARGVLSPIASPDRHVEADAPPTTRVVRAAMSQPTVGGACTTLVRGKIQVKRGGFEQDPVVGWLVVVGGPGIGQFRPVFEGNNTVGRSASNRVAIDFGDDAISADEQAYIRYDSADRSFLFVPNLAKTNVVSVNDKRPTGAVELGQMDVITMGRTQLVFVPFCGQEFDWSALSDK